MLLDFTFDSGMESVKKFFTPSEVAKFSGPDFRIRIMKYDLARVSR